MRLEVKVNVFCVLMILLSIFATAYFVLFNKKIGGNILNEGSEIVNGQYYLVDNDGKKNLVSRADWEKCKTVNIAFFSIAILGSLSLFYLFLRYAFLPSFIKNIHSIIEFFNRQKNKNA